MNKRGKAAWEAVLMVVTGVVLTGVGYLAGYAGHKDPAGPEPVTPYCDEYGSLVYVRGEAFYVHTQDRNCTPESREREESGPSTMPASVETSAGGRSGA